MNETLKIAIAKNFKNNAILTVNSHTFAIITAKQSGKK
jgi:hypothetical protein